MLIVTAIAALTFNSCKKEASQQLSQGTSVTNPLEREFKYSEEIRVYDDSKTYYIDVVIKSDDSNIFNYEIQNLKSSKVELVYEVPQQSVTLSNETSNMEEPSSNQNFESKVSSLIKIKSIYKGEAKGIRLKSAINTIKTQGIEPLYLITGYWTKWVEIGLCNWYTVFSYNKTLTVDDYWSDGTLHYIQTKVVSPGNTVTFSGTGYLYRVAIIQGNQNWAAEITLY